MKYVNSLFKARLPVRMNKDINTDPLMHMMRKLIFYLSGAIIAIFPVISFGQIVYTGTVVNKDTRVGIPYASIGLVKQNTGINADEEGHFRFETFTSRQDSFLVSCIGYETLKVPAGTSSSPLRFELQPRASSLQEVVVKTHYNWQKATLGAYSNCGKRSSTSSGRLSMRKISWQQKAR